MESKQVNSAAAKEQQRPSMSDQTDVRSSRGWLMMTRKYRTAMMRRAVKAKVAQKRITNNNGATFTGLLHAVMNRARLASSPSVQLIAPTASGPQVPKNRREIVDLGSTSAAPPVKQPVPTEMKEGNKMVEIGAEAVRRMPTVWTSGGIPNGQRIKGILYNRANQHGYILCCCHGHFFTYSEFIEHAGGGHVENPTKFIHVLPNGP